MMTHNLANQMQKRLPPELVDFIRMAGRMAEDLGQKLYLVGGVVRDLLLERKNLDLDLVAEGDALKLAEELAKIKNGKVIAHSRFCTAKIRWGRWSVDIASTRAETYPRPGALPVVQCGGDIRSDLIRRDFTINALSVYLDPLRYGEVVDLFHGREDLEHGLIRILHDNSFRDDATRVWRAVRYEQRLDFRLERHTLALLVRDLGYLEAISGDRIRHELELVLEEERPEKALLRANELGVLAKMCPKLEADDWLARKFVKARGILQPYCPPAELYLAFLFYRLPREDLSGLITYLKFTRLAACTLEDTLKLKIELPSLAGPHLAPSRIFQYLHPYSQSAILANLIASDSPPVRQRIELYLNKLRHVQPALTGEQLINMGIASGPRIREILETLREARLDGRAATPEQELELVKNMSKAAK
jgi:tRNA nucleotidyltransferase (CCA-adding enzyme)